MLSLHQLNVGDTAKLVGFTKQSPAHRQKLLAMGLTPGTQFSVVRLAPLRDPIEIDIRGYHLSLRKSESQCLLLEKVE